MNEQVDPHRCPEPVDPDVEPALGDLSHGPFGDLDVLLAVVLGGVLGSVARYEAAVVWPTHAGGFPWTTLWVNVLGCGLIGVLIVLVSDVFIGQRLLRPFLGTGVLGGFTTFSTYAVDAQRFFQTGNPARAVGYLALTLAAALAAVTVTTLATRRLVLR